MARIIAQALVTRTAHSSLIPTRVLISAKHRHTVVEGALIDIDLETATETGDSGAVRIVRLEDLIHTIMAQRSAPSWLPFIPGSSYWVPPKPSSKNLENLMNKCSSGPTLSDDEALSFTTVRGWPSPNMLTDPLVPGNEFRSRSEVNLTESKAADTEGEVQLEFVGVIDSDNKED